MRKRHGLKLAEIDRLREALEEIGNAKRIAESWKHFALGLQSFARAELTSGPAATTTNQVLNDVELVDRPAAIGGELEAEETNAIISDDGTYRYVLWRRWDRALPVVNFVMLNPSTADAKEDDPTIRRCIGFAKAWGYGGLYVTNLYALRSTDPGTLKDHPSPVGGPHNENNEHIGRAAMAAKLVVCAWGNNAEPGRADNVVQLLKLSGHDPHCLGTNNNGSPVHPLYQPKAAKPIPLAPASPEERP